MIRTAIYLPPGHPFQGTDGGQWVDCATRSRITQRASIPQLRTILETPDLQVTVRQTAERRLAWLTGAAPAPLRRHLATARAYTLVELLVVVLIIGILAGLALPGVSRAYQHARARAAWTAYWHQAQIHQVAVTDEFTAYWQMTPDAAFDRLYAARGVKWSDVDTALTALWSRSLSSMEQPTSITQ